MLQFNIGLSALQAAQQGLSIAGNNLANAATPGYHRQVANLVSSQSTYDNGQNVGTGVSINGINRIVNSQLETALTTQTSRNGFTDASLTASTQIEQSLASGTTSPSTQLEGLLNSLQQLSASPSSGASLHAAITSATNVANSFNTASADLSQIQQNLDSSIASDVNQINSLAAQIADLNKQISTANAQGVSPNDLLDKRGSVVNSLAKLANISVQNQSNGQINVILGSVAIVGADQADTLVPGSDKSGATTINATNGNNVAITNSSLSITGGDLGGLLFQRNQTLAGYQNRLDTLARQVAVSFNAIQTTGLGSAGGFTQLTGQNAASSSTANLNAAGLAFPPQAGTLYVGVTNTATGQRTINAVSINPQSQSLNDVANAIGTAVPNVYAYVNTGAGTLTIGANSGYTFDFSGGFVATPTTNFTAGTTTSPTFGGTYTGTTNDNYKVSFLSSGSVGVTPNLQAQVTNNAGKVVATLNVGQGYQVGQAISVANGITVSLPTGTVAAGDSFSTQVVGNPDSAGLLNSLGLNTLFTGSDAGSLKLSSDIVANPSRLATSTTGAPGDTTNLQKFTALGTTALSGLGTQTFSQYANQIVSDVGTDVQSLTSQQSTNQTLTANITAQQQSASGVDTNEELANVLQYQQQFEIAGKYISTVSQTLQSLLTLIP